MFGLTGAYGSLDEVGQGEHAERDGIVICDALRGAQGRLVVAGAELEDRERGVAMVEADAQAAVVRVAASSVVTPVRVASSFPCHASRRTVAGAGRAEQATSAGDRHEVVDLGKMRGGGAEATLQHLEPAEGVQRERECRQRTGSPGDLDPGVCQVVPGAVIEQLGGGEDDVVEHDVEVMADGLLDAAEAAPPSR